VYRTIILPIVLYGRGNCLLTLREERKLRISENRMLRRIFGSMRDETTGEWRKLHNDELSTTHPILFGSSIVKEMGGARSTYGGKEMCIQGFGGET
jgi:hypothetical protein